MTTYEPNERRQDGDELDNGETETTHEEVTERETERKIPPPPPPPAPESDGDET
jgi:hypothetical protein